RLPTPSRRKSPRGVFEIGCALAFVCLKESLSPLKSIFSGNAEGKHPNPVNCIGQAPCLPSAGWMLCEAGMATDYFLSDVCGLRQPFVRCKESLEFNSLLTTSRLRRFPLLFLVGKMSKRS